MLLLHLIEWKWWTLAVVIVYILGLIWYSLIFPKRWARLFNETDEMLGVMVVIRIALLHLIATAGFGLLVFIITRLEPVLAWAMLGGVVLWDIGVLNLRFRDTRTFLQAIALETVYLAFSGCVFVVLGTLIDA